MAVETKPVAGGPHLAEFRLSNESNDADSFRDCCKDARPFLFADIGRPELDELEGFWFVRSVMWHRDNFVGDSVYVVVKAERLLVVDAHSSALVDPSSSDTSAAGR